MGAINYTRSRLKVVYPFSGYDASKSEVKTVPAETVALSDKIEFIESKDYQFTDVTSEIGFESVFANAGKGAPNVFVVDSSGSTPQLGNLYISSVSTGSVIIGQSNTENGSFSALALVVL
ncbi:hypothetical protein CMI47_12690 [Candidatus Pacearchaeota archaeon]|nr:hypothetical protein [Candidatus Pacearchaeota archaeon]